MLYEFWVFWDFKSVRVKLSIVIMLRTLLLQELHRVAKVPMIHFVITIIIVILIIIIIIIIITTIIIIMIVIIIIIIIIIIIYAK